MFPYKSARNYIESYQYHSNSSWGWQRIILILIILQSMGIRALPMQGVLLSVLICLILALRISIPIKQLISFFILCSIFVSLSTRGMSDYTGIAYLFLSLLTAFFFVKYVEIQWTKVEFDLLEITWWLSLHGLISYILYKILPHSFSTLSLGGMKYKVLAFFVLNDGDLIRASGICWEPGLFQYIANLSLFLGIKYSWPRWKLAVSFLAVLVTNSTTGFFVLVPPILYFFLLRRKNMRQLVFSILCVTVLGVLCASIFHENIADKLGGTNTSGLIRLRDLQVGWELIKAKPLLGHGQFDEKYLFSQSNIWSIATGLFSKQFLSSSGEMGAGYTNGFLAVWARYGVFIGAFTYWCFFKNRVIQGGFKEHMTFFLISILTFFSEPITNTSWFFFLTISGMYSMYSRKVIIKIHNNTEPQKDSMAVT